MQWQSLHALRYLYVTKIEEFRGGIQIDLERFSRRIMQAFTSPYVCPYFTCSSPYCLTLRNTALASSLQSVNRSPSSPSQPGVSSFTISSILARSDDSQTSKTRSEDTNEPKSISCPDSGLSTATQFLPYSSHVSLERFHPYHRPLAASAFARTSCGSVQKGNNEKKLVITHRFQKSVNYVCPVEINGITSFSV